VIKQGSFFTKYNPKFTESIFLYQKDKAIQFNGNLNYFELLYFSKSNIVGRTMIRVSDSSQYDKMVKSHKYFFIFTGSKNSKRFKKITEAAKRYPKTLIFKITDKEVLKYSKLEMNQLYFKKSSLKVPQKYQKNFSSKKLKKWITRQVFRKYKRLTSYSYDMLKRNKKNYVILVVKGSKKYTGLIQKFLNFAEKTKMNIVFRICDMTSIGCKRFLFRVGKTKLNKQKTPSIFAIKASKQTSDDHMHFFKLKKKKETKKKTKIIFNLKKFKRFVVSVYKKQVLPKIFSEPIPVFESPDKFQKIVNKTLNHFLFEGADKDLVILFYDSRQCFQSCKDKNSVKWLCTRKNIINSMSMACDNLINQFKSIIKKIRSQWQDQEGLVRYGFYDLGKNSYDLLSIKKTKPFIRLYKMGKNDEYVDMDINQNLSLLNDEFTHFMLDNMEHLFEDVIDSDYDIQLNQNSTNQIDVDL
jgi:hypothetical protein